LKELFALLDRRNAAETALDRRTAIVAWAMHNCMSQRKDGEPWRIEDFMPGEKREQTPEEMMAVMMMAKGE
jgi:hypothetical protein